MNRKFFTSVILKEEGIRLDYFLLSENAVDIFGRECITYGVEIRQTPANTFSQNPYFIASVPDITCKIDMAEALLRELSATATDPSCLEDIVVEIIS